MLRACTLDFKSAWDKQLALIKFSYNNNYQASTGMAQYEALYGKKCRTPLYWQEIEEALTVGLELIQATTDKVRVILVRMRAAQSCQKSYANQRRWPS